MSPAVTADWWAGVGASLSFDAGTGYLSDKPKDAKLGEAVWSRTDEGLFDRSARDLIVEDDNYVGGR